MKNGDKVQFDQGNDQHTQLNGTVTRVWDKPGAPYVTIKADDGRTFVRVAAAVKKA